MKHPLLPWIFLVLLFPTGVWFGSCAGARTARPEPPTISRYRPDGAAADRILSDARAAENGGAAAFEQGNYAAALGAWQSAASNLVLIDNRRELLRVQNGIALALVALGRLDDAETNIESNLATARAAGNRGETIGALTARGRLQEARRDRDGALAAYRAALELALGAKERDARMIAALWSGIAYIHYQQGDCPAALLYYGRSVQLGQRIRDYASLAEAYTYMGECYLVGKRHREATIAFENALAADRALENPAGIALGLRNLGRVAEAAGRPRDAVEPLERALRIHTSLNMPRRTLADLEILVRLHETLGNRGKAREYRNFRDSLKRSLERGRSRR